MFFRLILLFTLIPFIELIVLLQVHAMLADALGRGTALLVTIGMIVGTGLAGAALARQQGLSVLKQLRSQMQRGEIPGQAAADGILVLIGAAFLLTPGLLTDLIGFSLLIPVTRKLFQTRLMKWFQQHVRVQRAEGADVFVVQSSSTQPQPERDRLNEPL